MFTGLIREVGTLAKKSDFNGGLEFEISAPDLSMRLGIGDSVAVNGVCSTVVKKSGSHIAVQYMEETLKKSNLASIDENGLLNLEASLRPMDPIDGHIVSGHVDTVGTIMRLENNEPWGVIVVSFPREFAKYVVEKGSITIDGISLTVVDAHTDSLSCHLIPHTIMHTNLRQKKAGDTVNLEFDLMGKYMCRFAELKAQ